MAWRPHQHLIEGELDNTQPGKVTGWMRFAGLERKVTFDLQGNFHRDIRGAKIRLRGSGCSDDREAAGDMDGLSLRQTGQVGDMTAGLPPHDYTAYPYIEWYGDDNGRVVLELDADQVEVIGMPIPACESDPISRDEQRRNMAEFVASLAEDARVPDIVVGPKKPIMSDPAFTHWVVESGQIVGEARAVQPGANGRSFADVRLFVTPEMIKHGAIESTTLHAKSGDMAG